MKRWNAGLDECAAHFSMGENLPMNQETSSEEVPDIVWVKFKAEYWPVSLCEK